MSGYLKMILLVGTVMLPTKGHLQSGGRGTLGATEPGPLLALNSQGLGIS